MKLTIAALLVVISTVPGRADWKVYADKKVNQITGVRNTHAVVGAKGLSTANLIIGCVDGKPILRIANRLRAFRVEGTPGAYSSPVKVRASASTEYVEEQATANVFNETMFLYLDDRAAELIPKMKVSESLFVELVYPNEQKVTEFRMVGLDVALGKMAGFGCSP